MVIVIVRNSIFNLEMSHGLTPMSASSTILLLEKKDFKTNSNDQVENTPHVVRQGTAIDENPAQLVHTRLA